MKVVTDNLYEASWYIMKGAVLTEVEISKASEHKRTKSGYINTYRITLENVGPQFVKYWKEHRAIGNIRKFTDARKNLKRRLYKIKLKRGL